VQQWRRRWKFFKSKAVILKVHRNTETVILEFSCFPSGILERQELFPRNYFAHKPRMRICPCPWAVGISKKNWNQTYFDLMTVDSAEILHHFAFWHHGSKLASFFIVPENFIL